MKLGIIGCGQIVQTCYIPALSKQKDIHISWLIDPSVTNRKMLLKTFRQAREGTDIKDIDAVDAVIIATPNGFHHSQVKFALQKGWHVLVEKPLANNPKDAHELVQLARERQRVCCVNLNRRFLEQVSILKKIIDKKSFGRILKITSIDGGRWTGNAQGGVTYHSSHKMSGGGVFLGTGSHMLDLPLYLLSAESYSDLQYFDDCDSNLEAECKFILQAKASSGDVMVEGFFSGVSQAAQKLIIECEGAQILALLNGDVNIQVQLKDVATPLEIPVENNPNAVIQSFSKSIAEFLNACQNRGFKPIHSAKSALAGLQAINDGYANRSPLNLPWRESENVLHSLRLSNQKTCKVAIVGAGGFLGYRLFERLAMHDKYSPKAITHSSMGSLSLLRYKDAPLEIGNAEDPAFLQKALHGCDIVVNCAINMKGSRNFAIKATRNIARSVAEVCGQIGIGRLVHISTIAVHGTYLGRKGEALRFDPLKSTYALAKMLSEKDVLNECCQNSTEPVVLRMGHIFGPYSAGWSAGQRDLIRNRKLICVEEWRNPSNTVYVDNAIDAIIAAMEKKVADNKIYYITDWPNRSWMEFYAPLLELEGAKISDFACMDIHSFDAIWRECQRNAGLQSFDLFNHFLRYAFNKEHLRAVRGDPRYRKFFNNFENLLSDQMFVQLKMGLTNVDASGQNLQWDLSLFDLLCSYASSIELPVEDAVRVLGYTPSVSNETAFRKTSEWLSFID